MTTPRDCRRCPRLARHLADVRLTHPDYHCAPVVPWGESDARLLIVGLAPGLHGANRTGIPFTGDSSGDFLFRHLRDFDWIGPDGGLQGLRITNAVKCLPPGNRPQLAEIRRCNRYLRQELDAVPDNGVVLALGRIAHEAVLRAESEKLAGFPFAHGAFHTLASGLRLVDSYHCSRYNTQTRRLTDPMFARVLNQIRRLTR